jgi:DNA repair protein RadC
MVLKAGDLVHTRWMYFFFNPAGPHNALQGGAPAYSKEHPMHSMRPSAVMVAPPFQSWSAGSGERDPVHLTDEQLVRALTGIHAPLRSKSLAVLCGLAPPTRASAAAVPTWCDDEASFRLRCARELFTRALTEQLHEQGPILDSPQSVRLFLQLKLSAEPAECFWVLFLDSQHRLIEAREMFRGTLTQTSVYPREIVRAALEVHAAAVVLAHNHPSGCTQPSRADEALTSNLKAALALVDVRVLDHFIVGEGGAASMAEKGLI